MAFSYTGGAQANGTSTTASITHGLTINSGDLVVAYINRNDNISIDNDGGGAAWTQAINEQPSTETARHSFFWKIAGASEPSSYSWTLNGNDLYQVIVKVFTSATDAVVDAAAVSAYNNSNQQNIICTAANGEVISDDAVSLIFGGKDNRGAGGTYVTVDNSYTGVVGKTDSQDTAGAHRIYTTGTTFSGSITFTDPGPSGSDKTYSVHASFVESSGSTYTLTSDSGTYTYTGTASTLKHAAKLNGSNGSYVFNGAVASLSFGAGLHGNSGSYLYAGTTVLLKHSSELSGNSGSYVYVGSTVDLSFSGALSANSGLYAYTGTAVNLITDRSLAAAVGSYAYIGTDAVLTYTQASGEYTLVADSGAYSYIGINVLLSVGRTVSADSGSYLYSGVNVSFTHNITVSFDSGTYSYNGAIVSLAKQSVLAAVTGSYVYSGATVTILAGGAVWTIQPDGLTTWTAQADSGTIWAQQTDDSAMWTVQ